MIFMARYPLAMADLVAQHRTRGSDLQTFQHEPSVACLSWWQPLRNSSDFCSCQGKNELFEKSACCSDISLNPWSTWVEFKGHSMPRTMGYHDHFWAQLCATAVLVSMSTEHLLHVHSCCVGMAFRWETRGLVLRPGHLSSRSCFLHRALD